MEKKYLQVYEHYKNLITSGNLKPGSRIPSVRRSSELLGYSGTTVEQAYMMLAADGYIISRPRSGFYVTELFSPERQKSLRRQDSGRKTVPVKYDFASAAADKESFRFEVWRRYMRSALRQDSRLLSYGEPQGERDLREVLARYLEKNRSVFCSADSIVVGAGTQSLLNILCPMIADRKEVLLGNHPFPQGRRTFEDFGFRVRYAETVPDEVKNGVVYAAPSQLTGRREAMSVRERADFLKDAKASGNLIIEDDYNSEFSYSYRPAPSMQGLSEGRGVVYLGTFSRLLMPSIRLSYMVLPEELLEEYRKRAASYNQTASKAEQIALCQYMRDGNLESQIRKARKRYGVKAQVLCGRIREVFGPESGAAPRGAGYIVSFRSGAELDAEEIRRRALKEGIALRFADSAVPGENNPEILLYLAATETEQYKEALLRLRNTLF